MTQRARNPERPGESEAESRNSQNLESKEGWENEGGSLGSPSSIPSGVTRHTEEIFTVGPYRYTNLADAAAEVERTRQRRSS
jgi:hypothetical protein